MRITENPTTGSLFSFTALWLLLFSVSIAAQDVFLCVWRNPERTMRRIFKDAKDYKTMTAKISEAERTKIEKKLGFTLLPGQQDNFQYFEMTGKEGKRIGTMIACSQKGQYGAVEFIFGLDLKNKINGIYVQRSRERDRSFKKRPFLDQFIGMSLSNVPALKKKMAAEKSPGSAAVIQGIIKELVTYNQLVAGKNG